MTVRDLFNYIAQVVPHVFPDTMLLLWLNELEGRVQLDILLLDPEAVQRYTLPDDESTQLLLQRSDAGLYRSWMKAMVHRANGEMAKYQNEMMNFNSAWTACACRHAEFGGR